MTGRWTDLDGPGRAAAAAAFTALETASTLESACGRRTADVEPAGAVGPSPSAVWAHVVGSAELSPAALAAALLADPSLRETLVGMLERAALAAGPAVAAAATGASVSERAGDGFRLRLLPSRADRDQTWVMIALDHPEPHPARLTVLPSAGSPSTVVLDPPVDGTVQLSAATDSALVRALADPAARVFLL